MRNPLYATIHIGWYFVHKKTYKMVAKDLPVKYMLGNEMQEPFVVETDTCEWA